ncbi:hypothetical protein Q8A64_16825 [Oxalobacteraceae bacterium R-40]|uniref:Uncharacterized protein n=1 Tax=Keguizhuia sedimenti TaxID=3064264 RepID=A0ABU1BSS7_9BURK|nr:hypothetical protein [Oxalobacteraceae bacterium R-40]
MGFPNTISSDMTIPLPPETDATIPEKPCDQVFFYRDKLPSIQVIAFPPNRITSSPNESRSFPARPPTTFAGSAPEPETAYGQAGGLCRNASSLLNQYGIAYQALNKRLS